jgi:hypothetical protein
MLGHVRQLWCADAFTVGFKLETDPDLLAFKAVSSLRKYRMHVVVANEMDKRKDEVVLISLGEAGHGGSNSSAAPTGGLDGGLNGLGPNGGPKGGALAFGEEGGGGYTRREQSAGAGTGVGGADRVEEAGQTGLGPNNGVALRDWIRRPAEEPDIERLLIAELVARHRAYVVEFMRPKTTPPRTFAM